MSHKYLAITGTMGAGKTTVGLLLASHFKIPFFEERFLNNPFLELFYQDMNRWSFHSQLFFLKEKGKQLSILRDQLAKTHVLVDAPLEQTMFCYSSAQHKLGYLNKQEWLLLREYYDLLAKYLPKPDVIIYIDTPLEIILERINSERDPLSKLLATNI